MWSSDQVIFKRWVALYILLFGALWEGRSCLWGILGRALLFKLNGYLRGYIGLISWYFVLFILCFNLFIIFSSGEFFTPILTIGFFLKSEWQQVSSSLQDTSLYSSWSLQRSGLDGLDSSNLLFFQFPFLETIPSAPTTIGVTITLTFHCLFGSPARSKYFWSSFYFYSVVRWVLSSISLFFSSPILPRVGFYTSVSWRSFTGVWVIANLFRSQDISEYFSRSQQCCLESLDSYSDFQCHQSSF